MRGPVEMLATFRALSSTENVSYILSADLQILRINRAWDRFARDNGGGDVLARRWRGTSLLDVIPPALRPFYERRFSEMAHAEEAWNHDYECSSPTVFRRFRMTAYPFSGSFVITHALLVSTPHTSAAHEPSPAYVHEGLVRMCSHCRRVEHVAATRWDWVPAFVERLPANTSHGLCPGCYTYYYA